MRIEEIDVVIDRDGKVDIRVRQVKGDQCLKLTKDLEAALGGQITSRQMTAGAYEVAEQENQVRQGIG